MLHAGCQTASGTTNQLRLLRPSASICCLSHGGTTLRELLAEVSTLLLCLLQVLPNDLYIHNGVLEENPVYSILQAQALGAAAVISTPLLSEQGLPLSVPDMDIPCFEVSDVHRVQNTLAQTFYEHPSERMLTVGVTGGLLEQT